MKQIFRGVIVLGFFAWGMSFASFIPSTSPTELLGILAHFLLLLTLIAALFYIQRGNRF